MQNNFSFSLNQAGGGANTNPTPTTSTPFSFGSPITSNLFGNNANQPQAKPLLSFGNSAATTSGTSTSTNPAPITSTPSSGGFSFFGGGASNPTSNASNPTTIGSSLGLSTGGAFSFGAKPNAPTTTTTGFGGFGLSNATQPSTTTTTTNTGLSLGLNPTTTTTNTSSPFSFGTSSTTNTAANPLLGAGTTSQQPATTTTNAFSFGAKPAATSSTTTTTLPSLLSLNPTSSLTGQPAITTNPTTTSASPFSFGATNNNNSNNSTTTSISSSSTTPVTTSTSGFNLFKQPQQPTTTATTTQSASTNNLGSLLTVSSSTGEIKSDASTVISAGNSNQTGTNGGLSLFGAQKPVQPGGFSFGAATASGVSSSMSLSTLGGGSTLPKLGTEAPKDETKQPSLTLPTTGTSTNLALPSSTSNLTSAASSTATTAPTTSTLTTTKPTLTLGTTTTTPTPTAPAATSLTTTTNPSDKTSTNADTTIKKPTNAFTTVDTSTLPNVLTFSNSSFSASGGDSKNVGLGGINIVSGTSTNSQSTNAGGVGNVSLSTSIIKSHSLKDQPLPQPLMEFVENYKKNLEEMRKIKELNATFSSRSLHQNIQEIISVKQKLTQSRTEFQRNCNETSKIKGQIAHELRNVDICEHLKDMPLGLQYDNDIWNEFFLSRVDCFQNKMRNLKSQFEQLEGYFKVHDRDNMNESQKVIETIKATQHNLLKEAATLKLVHENIEELKKNFLIHRKNTTGDSTNIFEIENDENSRPVLNSSLVQNRN